MLAVLLEGGMGSGGGDAGFVGIVAFVIACIGLVIGPLCLLIALIIYLADNSKIKSPAYKVFIRIGVGGLVVAGICLLLTAMFCSWR